MKITLVESGYRLSRVLLGMTLSLCLVACSKNTSPASSASSPIPTSASAPTTSLSATPSPSLTNSALDAVRQLVGPSLLASQRDTFGQIVLKESTFDVRANGSVAVVQLEGISPLLLACNGEISGSDGTQVPYSMAVVVQFGAYEIANLSPSLFSRVPLAEAFALRFTASIPDKYGHPEEREFFKSMITRAEASKMDWDWFRGAVLRGTFDPSAFNEFNIFFGNPPTAQDMGEVLRVLRESSEHATEAYGLPDPKGEALAAATKMANWSNCALSGQ